MGNAKLFFLKGITMKKQIEHITELSSETSKKNQANRSLQFNDNNIFISKSSDYNPALKYLGFSLLLAYHYVLWFNPESFYPMPLLDECITISWLSNLFGTVLSMTIITLLLRRTKHLSCITYLYKIIPLVLIAATLVLESVAPSIQNKVLLIISALTAGAAEGSMLILWGECLVRSNAKFSVIHIGATFGCTLFACMVLGLIMPNFITPVFTVTLIVLSGILLITQTKTITQDYVTLLPKKVSLSALRTAAVVCLIGFITSVACYYLAAIIPWEKMPSGIYTFTFGIFAASVLILIVCVLCSLGKEKATIFKIFPYYLVLAIVCLTIFIWSKSLYLFSFLGALCISSLLEVSLIMYFGILMQRGFFSPAAAFTFSVVSARFGIFIGNSLALFYEFNPSIAKVATEPTALLFVCALALLLIQITKREQNIIQLTHEPVKPTEIEVICTEISIEFSLSTREEEILKLIAKGNTANNIAQKLYISPHTVNTHIRHIYEKVGIHKKGELLEYINMRKDDTSST